MSMDAKLFYIVYYMQFALKKAHKWTIYKYRYSFSEPFLTKVLNKNVLHAYTLATYTTFEMGMSEF